MIYIAPSQKESGRVYRYAMVIKSKTDCLTPNLDESKTNLRHKPITGNLSQTNRQSAAV